MEGDGDRKRWRTKEMGTGRDEDLEGWRPRGTRTGRDGDARATWRVPRVSDCTSRAGTRYAVSPSGARTEPGTSAHLGLQPHPSAAQVPPRSPPDSGLGFRILRSLRRGAPWVFPERHPAAPAPPPYTPGAPRLSEGGDVTGGGAWGAGGKGVRARGPRVAACAGSRPSSPLFVEPPRPQIPVPLQTRILLIATPPNPCSVTPFPCTWICLQMPPKACSRCESAHLPGPPPHPSLQ